MTAQIGSHIGPSVDRCTDDPLYTLGEIVWGKDGKAYRYVQFKDAVTYVAGHVVCLKAASWAVTNDVSGNMAGDHPVGVVFQTTVPTENQYGFVQVAGEATFVAGSASIVAGDWLKPDASEDGDMEEATAGTDENICAFALATVADNASGACLLYNLL